MNWKLLCVMVCAAALVVPAYAATVIVDPDAFPNGTVLNNAFPGVTLSASGDSGAALPNSDVISRTRGDAPTGTQVFGHNSPTATNSLWGNGFYTSLRADFAGGTSNVTIDVRADDGFDANAFLRAFDAANNLLDSDVTPLDTHVPGIVTLSVTAANIAYITSSWDDINFSDNGILDRLTYQTPNGVAPVPVPAAVWGGMALMSALGLNKFRKGRNVQAV